MQPWFREFSCTKYNISDLRGVALLGEMRYAVGMSNWTLKLPFHWSIRGGWCTRDRVGGVNYSTNGLRDALRIQRQTRHLKDWDAQVVTYSLIVEWHGQESGWAYRSWQTEITANYHPRLRIRKHTHALSVLKSTWLKDTEEFYLDSNKPKVYKQQTMEEMFAELADWEKEVMGDE